MKNIAKCNVAIYLKNISIIDGENIGKKNLTLTLPQQKNWVEWVQGCLTKIRQGKINHPRVDRINLQQVYQCLFINNFSRYYLNIATLKLAIQELNCYYPFEYGFHYNTVDGE